MQAINWTTDEEQRQRFKWLHGLPAVVVVLVHIAADGSVPVRTVGR